MSGWYVGVGVPILSGCRDKPGGTCRTGIFIGKITTNGYRYSTVQGMGRQGVVGMRAGEHGNRE